MAQKRFKRANRAGSRKSRTDKIGKVTIAVTLREKGNLARAVTVANARVSEVFAVIDKALFG